MTKLGFVKKGLMSNLVPTNKKLVERQKYILKDLHERFLHALSSLMLLELSEDDHLVDTMRE